MALVSSARSTIPTFGDGLELAADLLELVSFVELFLTNFSNRCQQKLFKKMSEKFQCTLNFYFVG